MADKRRVLRASPPHPRLGRLVQVQVDSATYRILYDRAVVAETSISDLLRAIIKKGLEA